MSKKDPILKLMIAFQIVSECRNSKIEPSKMLDNYMCNGQTKSKQAEIPIRQGKLMFL
jgi:hypothetical protein